MSYMSDLDLVRQELEEYQSQDISAAMAVRDLMSAANTIFQLATQKSTARSVIIEADDIELTYVQLGRMLSAIRKGQRRAA